MFKLNLKSKIANLKNNKVQNGKIPKKKNTELDWKEADDLKSEIIFLVDTLKLSYIRTDRVFCFRTKGSKSSARARIWGLPKILQRVLEADPAYVIEAVSEKFDHLSEKDKRRVLIHELLHIPRNFSGSLLPHKYGHIKIEKEVNFLINKIYTNKTKL